MWGKFKTGLSRDGISCHILMREMGGNNEMCGFLVKVRFRKDYCPVATEGPKLLQYIYSVLYRK
jgi:hypothetical protein